MGVPGYILVPVYYFFGKYKRHIMYDVNKLFNLTFTVIKTNY